MMMFTSKGFPRRPWFALAVILATGCADSQPANDQSWGVEPGSLRPVSGTVTLQGKPLAKAIVAFFPTTAGVPSVGETGDDGRYTIQSMNMDGAPPGEYKVAISYLLSTDGKPQSLADRSAMVHSEAMVSARESLPLEYADANKTKLRATVTDKGGEFNFDIDATPVVPEKPKPAPAEPESKDAPSPEPADTGGAAPGPEKGASGKPE